MFQNVMVGYPIVALSDLIPPNEFNETLVTSTRYLPKILVEAGIVQSTSEVRRNRPDLCITFPDNMTDCITVKWGKKFLYVIVGRKDPFDIKELYLHDPDIYGISFDTFNWYKCAGSEMCKNSKEFYTKKSLFIDANNKITYEDKNVYSFYILTAV